MRALLLLPVLAAAGCAHVVGLHAGQFEERTEKVSGIELVLRPGRGRPDVDGIALAPWRTGLAQVRGLSAAPVADGRSFAGLTVGAIQVCAQEDASGLQLGGLLVQAEDRLTGLSAALSVGAGRRILGVAVAPLAVTPYRLRNPEGWVAEDATGLTVAGLRAEFPLFRGVVVAPLVRCREAEGLALGIVVSDVREALSGLQVGLVNRTGRLRGVQIGLLNRVADRPAWLRWMPLVNVGWWTAPEGEEKPQDGPGDVTAEKEVAGNL